MLIVSVYSKKALPYQKLLYERAGWTVIESTDEYVVTKEGLISYRFDREELKDLFGREGYEVFIFSPTKISLILTSKKLSE